MGNQRTYVDLPCPMPKCGEQLYLVWQMSLALYNTSVGVELVDDLPTPNDAHTSTWKVECGEGHVILTPGSAGCECDDQGGEKCPHVDERDWSEESRTFRRHDAERLLAFVEQLSAVARG